MIYSYSFYCRKDGNLQYIVYKLVPDLYKKEMQRRREFFSTHPKGIKHKMRGKLDKEALGESNDEAYFLLEKNYGDMSISLEYSET